MVENSKQKRYAWINDIQVDNKYNVDIYIYIYIYIP